jgi:hypothetical protein
VVEQRHAKGTRWRIHDVALYEREARAILRQQRQGQWSLLDCVFRVRRYVPEDG